MDFLAEYAKSIGKNTCRLTFWDMIKCYDLLEKKSEGGANEIIFNSISKLCVEKVKFGLRKE